jgi:rubredoxin
MKYRCTLCSYVYDPALGDPDNGVKPGTAFENLPAEWVCPDCGAGKEDFEPVDE